MRRTREPVQSRGMIPDAQWFARHSEFSRSFLTPISSLCSGFGRPSYSRLQKAVVHDQCECFFQDWFAND